MRIQNEISPIFDSVNLGLSNHTRYKESSKNDVTNSLLHIIIFTTLCPPLVAPNFCHLEVTTGSSDVGLGGLYACLCHAVHGRQKRQARKAHGLPNLTANMIGAIGASKYFLGQVFFALPKKI